MLYVPAVNPVIVYGIATPIALPEALPVQVTSPVPAPPTTIEPVAVAHIVGLFALDIEITGFALTVIVTAAISEQPEVVPVTLYVVVVLGETV